VVRKVIVPAAGLGTRLFPVTKEQPKEMLPVFSKSATGELVVKPVVQLVFEQLYDVGLREFCFVVGRGKRSIEDHFTPDVNCIRSLELGGKNGQAEELEGFYHKLRSSTCMWVNQPEPRGFGSAVLLGRSFVQNEECVVHAGDSCIVSGDMGYLRRLLDVYEGTGADAAFLVLEIENPRQYGIVEGEEVGGGVFRVRSVVEKPKVPKSNLAVMAMYVFKPVIFRALEETSVGVGGEVQLTDAIQKLVEWGLNVYAVKLDSSYAHLDVGSPERYWEALHLSHREFCRRKA